MLIPDEIRIENLECFAYHGVYPAENEQGQYFYVNAALYTDVHEAAKTDDLNQTTNYGEVARFIHEFMGKDTYKLIETVAEKMATAILLEFPLIKTIELEIRKPDAPIKLNFSSVSIKIARGWKRVYVATGSNLGDSENIIKDCITKIKANQLIRDVKTSALIKSTPYGVTDQPDFVNGAVEFQTLLSPKMLLEFLQNLENEAGRKKSVRWGARTLDLDILLYEDMIMDEEDLVIPHPDLHNRDFVLMPLVSLNQHLQHPTFNCGMKKLLADLAEKHVISQSQFDGL